MSEIKNLTLVSIVNQKTITPFAKCWHAMIKNLIFHNKKYKYIIILNILTKINCGNVF